MKLAHKGNKYTVVFDDEAKYNSYYLYRHTYEPRRDGHGTSEHKRLIAKYANLSSALHVLSRIEEFYFPLNKER